MTIIKHTIKYLTVMALGLCATTATAQNYGALQHLLQKRPANEQFESKRWNDHFFFSAGVGIQHLMIGRSVQDEIGVSTHLNIGKWFTPIHGLRVGGNVGYFPTTYNNAKMKYGGLNADYLLNISALAYGYNPDRKFELIGVAGIDGGYNYVNKEAIRAKIPGSDYKGFYAGYHFGMQANFRINPVLDFYVEPQVSWLTDSYTRTETPGGYVVSGGLSMGLVYTPGVAIFDRIHHDNFDRSSFLNHTFLMFGGGISAIKVPGIRNTMQMTGPQVTGGIGKWFSPYSALRASLTTGVTQLPGNTDLKFKHLDTHLDYLFNISSILWGYNEERFFNLNGVVGPVFSVSKIATERKQTSWGAGVGIQGTFRLNKDADLFIEPRFNFFEDSYAGGTGWRESDQLFEINMGVIYKATDRARRAKAAFMRNRWDDNLFFTTGIGAQMALKRSNIEDWSTVGPQFSATVGKWFSPSSGLRLVFNGGYFFNHNNETNKREENKTSHINLSGGIDYLWNITSTFAGYEPNRIYELIGSAGVDLAFVSRPVKRPQVGVGIGLQNLWHVTDRLGIYLEPKIRLYSDKLIEGSFGPIRKDIMASVEAGVHYRFTSPKGQRKHTEEAERKTFISGAAGWSMMTDNGGFKNAGGEAKVSIGRWIHPLLVLRANGDVVAKAKNDIEENIYYGGLGVDCMTSIGKLLRGKDAANSIQKIDLLPFVGVNAGLSRFPGEFKFTSGIDVGAQLKLRLSPALDFFVEPKYGIRSAYYDRLHGGPDKICSLLGGFSYKFPR